MYDIITEKQFNNSKISKKNDYLGNKIKVKENNLTLQRPDTDSIDLIPHTSSLKFVVMVDELSFLTSSSSKIKRWIIQDNSVTMSFESSGKEITSMTEINGGKVAIGSAKIIYIINPIIGNVETEIEFEESKEFDTIQGYWTYLIVSDSANKCMIIYY